MQATRSLSTSRPIRAGALSQAWPTIGLAALLALGWAAVALIFAALAQVAATVRGTPQAWWPSFGYALAVFSIWALLSVPVVRIAGRLAEYGWRRRLVAAGIGVPLLMVTHVALFSLLYWPLYGAGQSAGLVDMARKVALANYDLDLVIGVALIGYGGLRRRREAPVAATSPARPATIAVRSRRRVRYIPADAIDWIGAAGNYSELHCGEEVHLADAPLGTLLERLPTGAFARIHRSQAVRIAGIAQVRSLGRGDAAITLHDGVELRLSRHFGAALRARLNGSDAGC